MFLPRTLTAQNEDREVDLNMNSNRNRKLVHPTLLFFSLIICLAFFAGAQSSLAQTTGSATLRGTVKDSQGALVRGATISVVNERTKDERKTITNDDGVYVFSALTPGTYKIKMELQGFKTSEQAGVAVETKPI